MFKYKYWAIPEKLHIFVRKGITEYGYPEARIAKSDTENSILLCKRWASQKDFEFYINDDDYDEYIVDNEGIEISIIEKFSPKTLKYGLNYYYCSFKKDDLQFVMKLRTDTMLNLFRDCNFNKGKCDKEIIFAKCFNKWVPIYKEQEIYNTIIDYHNEQQRLRSLMVRKQKDWEPGYNYGTPLIKEILLYNLYEWYSYQISGRWMLYETYDVFLKDTPIKKPITIMYEKLNGITNLSEWFKSTDKYHIKKRFDCSNCPEHLHARIKGEKLVDIDCSISQIQKELENYQRQKKDEIIYDIEMGYYVPLEDILKIFLISADPNIKPEIPEEILDIMPQKKQIYFKEENNG